jgi:rubrerythrin
MFTPAELLELAIRIEENGEAVYRRAAERVKDGEIAALLGWMADEEATHAAWFAARLTDLTADPASPFMAEMTREVLADLVGNRAFSLDDSDLSSMDNVAAVLKTALEFEEDTVTFYEILAPFVTSEEAREHLRRIVAEERRHIDKLTALLKEETALAPV